MGHHWRGTWDFHPTSVHAQPRPHEYVIFLEKTVQQLTSLGNSCSVVPRKPRNLKQEATTNNQTLSGSISIPLGRPLKRHRSRTITSRDVSTARSRPSAGGMRILEAPVSQIQVNDSEKLAEWYKEAFLTLQQVACRLVAKVWIKKIHPKKVGCHPEPWLTGVD